MVVTLFLLFLLLLLIMIIMFNRFYIELFSVLKQTHCAYVACDSV